MPRSFAESIHEQLDQVATDPLAQHPNVTKLQNRTGFRLRIGDWRVIYDVQKDELVIHLLKMTGTISRAVNL
jgi:mRNA interferase RelE/StbE